MKKNLISFQIGGINYHDTAVSTAFCILIKSTNMQTKYYGMIEIIRVWWQVYGFHDIIERTYGSNKKVLKLSYCITVGKATCYISETPKNF